MQCRADHRCLDAQLLAQPRDADLEEFIQIAADDTQETQPLEQRDRRVLGEGEHAVVEGEQ